MTLKPIIATPMASSHMRMRVQSPMLTMSATAPMVQKCVRCAIAPKAAASANAAHSTWVDEPGEIGFLHRRDSRQAPRRRDGRPGAPAARRYLSDASRSLPACAASDCG